MTHQKWGLWQHVLHWLIHRLDDGLIGAHDALIDWACGHNLWQTPEQREVERPPRSS